MINAHGVTYPDAHAARLRVAALRVENAQYGPSDGRMTEINAIEAAIEASILADPSTLAGQRAAERVALQPRETVVVDDEDGRWTVVYDEFPSPCDHPQCALLHRRFFTGTERGTQWVTQPQTGRDYEVAVVGFHEKINRQWVVLLNGSRVGDAHDTKRDAVREASGKPTI